MKKNTGIPTGKVTGIFQDRSTNRIYEFRWHNNKISMYESTHENPVTVITDPSIPIPLIQAEWGKQMPEDYRQIDPEDHYRKKRNSVIRNRMRNGEIPGFFFNGLEVPVRDHEYEHAVGPIHADLIEPGHFRFILHGEMVQNLDTRLGFQHRNIRSRLKGKFLAGVMGFSGQIAGDSTVAWSIALAEAYESSAGFSVPAETSWIRRILLELERIAVHIGDLGALSADIGYYPLHAVCSTDRGVPLGILEALTGSRFGKSSVWPGGVIPKSGLSEEKLKSLADRLQLLKSRLGKHFRRVVSNPSIRERLQECGRVTRNEVEEHGFTGMVARCTGRHDDLRLSEKERMIYTHNGIKPEFHPDPAELSGDAWARMQLRFEETNQSIDWLIANIPLVEYSDNSRQAAADLVRRNSVEKKLRKGVWYSAIEGWRGPVVVALSLGKGGALQDIYLRDPSVLNWMAKELAIVDELIGDFPLNNKSFNLSYTGADL